MSDTLELTASWALLEARHLRSIADALEHLAKEAYVKELTHVQPMTWSKAFPFTALRVTFEKEIAGQTEMGGMNG